MFNRSSSYIHCLLSLWAHCFSSHDKPILILIPAPTSFCKCTCNFNSTIIPLNPGSSSSDPDSIPIKGGTCNDCNRQFCLDYNLPICKDVEGEKIFTTCFRKYKWHAPASLLGWWEKMLTVSYVERDSAKDQAVVYTFIFMTVGLLIYAAVKPWLEKRTEVIHWRHCPSLECITDLFLLLSHWPREETTSLFPQVMSLANRVSM